MVARSHRDSQPLHVVDSPHCTGTSKAVWGRRGVPKHQRIWKYCQGASGVRISNELQSSQGASRVIRGSQLDWSICHEWEEAFGLQQARPPNRGGGGVERSISHASKETDNADLCRFLAIHSQLPVGKAHATRLKAAMPDGSLKSRPHKAQIFTGDPADYKAEGVRARRRPTCQDHAREGRHVAIPCNDEDIRRAAAGHDGCMNSNCGSVHQEPGGLGSKCSRCQVLCSLDGTIWT